MNNEEFKDAINHRLAEAKFQVRRYQNIIEDRQKELRELHQILETWIEVQGNYQGVLDDLG